MNITDAERIENDILKQSLIVISKENDKKCTIFMESMCDANTENSNTTEL